MSLEGKISNVDGSPFGMVMWVDSLMEYFFFNVRCFGKVNRSKNDLVMAKMVVGVVERVV